MALAEADRSAVRRTDTAAVPSTRRTNRTGSSTRQGGMRILGGLRPIAFVLVSALVMVVGSERIYWYYTDADVRSFVELAAFYAIGAYALLWTIERFSVNEVWSLLVAAPVFAYVVEGVITPVLYEGGPTPIFPAYFTGWHGLLSVMLLWFGVRRWLVAGRWRPVLVTAVVLGGFWGVHATAMWLPANLDDPQLAESQPAIREPLDFLWYAVRSTAALMLGHLLLGRGLWVRRLGRSRVAEWGAALTIVGIVAVWTVMIPWAAPMFVALLGGVAWVLRRHRRTATGPTLFEQLDGRVSLRDLAMLIPMPFVATGVYAALFALDPDDAVIEAVMWGSIAAVGLAGGTAIVASWSKVLRRPSDTSGARPDGGDRPPWAPPASSDAHTHAVAVAADRPRTGIGLPPLT
jgi:hypothetical protein